MNLRQRIVISVLLAAAVVGIVVGFQMSQDPKDKPVVRDTRIAEVFPPEGDTMVRQDKIHADIAIPYDGVLKVDGVEIPKEQTVRVQVGNSTRLEYTPGANSVTGTLAPGRHSATVLFWLPAQGRQEASEQRWTFSVR